MSRIPKPPKEYLRQLETMLENANLWRKRNPHREALIQFNCPPNVALISPISTAVENHFVSTNEAGMELLKALWPRWDDRTEPTVMMCRCVLETKPRAKRPPPSKCPTCGEKTVVRASMGLVGEEQSNQDVEPGSLNVCACCAGVSIFTEKLTMRSLTQKERDELPADVAKMISTAVEAIKANPWNKDRK